ncbi:MAG: transketolase [bacterium]|nr:transketolase [bacterium]
MATELSPALREQIENTIRGLTIDAVAAAGIGHLGAAMGLARPVFQLWDRHLRFDPQDPDWPLRDRFVLSGGHASMLLYSLLHLFGFELPFEEIKNFRKLGSMTPGHPEYGDTPGVEVTTGPLGQGLANAVGMAIAGRATRSRYGVGSEGPGQHVVVAVAGDGDMMEGISYEASSLAGHLGLGNLVVLYDDNQVTIDGPTDITFTENVRGRFEAQGWHVQEVDGEDVDAFDVAFEAARSESGRPSLLITRTVIGHGSPNWAGLSKAHGGPFKDGEDRLTKENLGIPLEPTFHVASEVRAYMDERAKAKTEARREADVGFEAWQASHPERFAAWQAARERKLPEDFEARLLEGFEGETNATRVHSGAVIQRLVEAAPIWLGGSADLAGSNNTTIKDSGFVGQGEDPFAGANLHFGVREHAMGAITNGIALDGTFLPFSGTFMVFSDYMRPSVRLAALMGIPSTFVFTHDSIFVGEDGPTHQPVEHVDALRSIPGLTVFRPADGIEVAMAWAYQARNASGPMALALSRQKVAALKREAPFEPRDVWKGGYVVREPEAGLDLVLLASGSEVALASEAASMLGTDGIRARVVSIPCAELLAEQDDAYQDRLVPEDVPVVAVEAGIGEGLRRWVGRRGLVHGMKGFGKSASYQALEEHFGFTAPKLVAAVREHLNR